MQGLAVKGTFTLSTSETRDAVLTYLRDTHNLVVDDSVVLKFIDGSDDDVQVEGVVVEVEEYKTK